MPRHPPLPIAAAPGRRIRVLLFATWLAAGPGACEPVERQPPPARWGRACLVRTVIDGDSIRCADGREVRLLSIDAPELSQSPWGERARNALLLLAPPGTRLEVEHDVELRDEYGRDLAYVWLPGRRMVNEMLVERGYALSFVVPPNRRHTVRIRRAERAARATGSGLWKGWGFACSPAEYRRGRCPR